MHKSIYQPHYLLFILLLSCGTLNADTSNTGISLEWLKQSTAVRSPWQTSAFKQPAQTLLADKSTYTLTDGHLSLRAEHSSQYFKLLKDRFKSDQNKSLLSTRIPPLELDFVRSGNHIIPSNRSVRKTDHPYWEWLVSPGVIWQQANDDGYSRIVLPFALQEKNANCTHTGYLLILLKQNSPAAYGLVQIAAETCGYLQFDLAARLKVEFTATEISTKPALVDAFNRELDHQLPAYSLTELNQTYPKLHSTVLMRPQKRGSSTSGLVIKGKNYRLHCDTRYGPDPYCQWLPLPSYSTAKSIIAGIGLMAMEAKYPNVKNVAMTRTIPECDTKSWQGVSLSHLINMRTGNYLSRKPEADEASARMLKYFTSQTHKEKLQLACQMFPHRAKPGKRFVYHTSDTYLAGLMLNRLYQRFEKKSDFYRDWLVAELWQRLQLSPLMADTKRTYDTTGQALTGVGLTYYIDDIIKISRFLFAQLEAPEPILARQLLANALQRGPVSLNFPTEDPTLAYNNGFWALEVSQSLGCKHPKWIPFMSGYGGITVALISPDLVYYNYADDYQYRWLEIIKELNHQFNLCEA